MTRYITLAEYFWLAEQVTGTQAAVLIKASRVDLADSALHASAAGFGEEEFYPDLPASDALSNVLAHETVQFSFGIGLELPAHETRLNRSVLA